MRRLLFIFALIFSLFFPPNISAHEGEPIPATYTYLRGTVYKITLESTSQFEGKTYYTQTAEVRLSGSNQLVSLETGSNFQMLNESQKLKEGQQIVLVKQEDESGIAYNLVDAYRLPVLIILAAAFLLFVVGVAGMKGTTSILGLVLSFTVLITYIIPQILNGSNPVLVSFIGSTAISAVTMYLSHGINKRSHIAFFSMIVTLTAVALIAYASIYFARLSGLGDETAAFLQLGETAHVNLQGLLLGGIVLGALSVLDDITVSQVSIVQQLKEAKPHISIAELLQRSMAIGKDHIASLVNTLVLAYAGASLPLFLLFFTEVKQPLWVILNDQLIAEEIVRTLTGSIGLVLSVPLSTIVATYVFTHHTKGKKGGRRD